MSVCVDLIKVDVEPLKDCMLEKLKVENNKENRDLIQKILEKFGTIIDSKYLIVNDEYTEDYNCYYNVCRVIASAFNQNEDDVDLFDCFYDNKVNHEWLISHADTWEIASDLNIDLIYNEEDY